MTKRLKNSEYASIRGREKRLDAEKKAHQDGVPVPFSTATF
ncbi:hypothetical protein ACEZDF_21720 [Vibrio alginolyticus]